MINDQWTSIKNEMLGKIYYNLVIDFKKESFTEKRSLMEILTEIFGDTIGINWLLPFNEGGFKKYFKILKKNGYNNKLD